MIGCLCTCFRLSRMEKRQGKGTEARSLLSLALLKCGGGVQWEDTEVFAPMETRPCHHKRASRFSFFYLCPGPCAYQANALPLGYITDPLPILSTPPFPLGKWSEGLSRIMGGEGASQRAAPTDVSLGAMYPHPVRTSASSPFSLSSMSLFV